MSRTRMGVALGSLALAFTVGAPTAIAAPAAPSDGTYTFVVERGGQKVGDSSVSVKRGAFGVAVHEAETFPGISETVDETLDPSDLRPTSYVSSFPLSSEVGVTARVAFDAGGAKQTVDGTTGITDFRLESGTSRMLVIDGVMASGFLMLPAQIQAMSIDAFTLLSPSRADTYDCRSKATGSAFRPAGIPAADVAIQVDGSSAEGGTQFIEWYDPHTMVVDEVDVPASQVTISRAHGT